MSKPGGGGGWESGGWVGKQNWGGKVIPLEMPEVVQVFEKKGESKG